jgi:hypothetical protein
MLRERAKPVNGMGWRGSIGVLVVDLWSINYSLLNEWGYATSLGEGGCPGVPG